MDQQLAWNILDKYFQDNPSALISHHLESYNDFFNGGINRIFRERNPIKKVHNQNPDTKNYKFKANIYLAGKDGNRIYYGKPIIFDEQREHYMYPNEARLRNMTYGMSIHYDVEVDFFIENDDGTIVESSIVLEKILLGRFPIMLMSNLCILNGFNRNVRYTMGECKNDLGGYFIIDGKEKAILSQEKFADNMLYIRDKVNDIYSHSAEIRSVSEDASKPIRTLSIRILSPSALLSNNQIVVNVPNVRKPIPLFILMRALGITSDKQIIECCLLDIEKYSSYIDLFIPSIYDAGPIFTQATAIKYIATFTKGKTIPHVLEILMNYLLPNIGELNFYDKACFIGHMVLELLKVFTKESKPTDRDSFKYKRIEVPGMLIYDLFKEYYTLQQKNIFLTIDKEYYYKQGIYNSNFPSLISNNVSLIFKDRIVEKGFTKAFKGNWGSEEHTKRLGIVQGLPRLSFNSYISIMRKIILPLDSSAKVVGPRLLNASQWNIIDPVDTPDGGNIGLHKHMSILTKITKLCSIKPIIQWLRTNTNMRILNECSFKYLSQTTKVFVNGVWIGVIEDPINVKNLLINHRRNGLIPIYTSISWEIKTNTMYIYTDAGRLCNPVYFIEELESKTSSNKNKTINKLSIHNQLSKINDNKFTWNELISGFSKKKGNFNINDCKLFMEINELYDTSSLESLTGSQAILEYIDTAEKDTSLICINYNDLQNKQYTHMEIHPSIILGVMGNQVIFPENNPLPRNLFSCGQSKQAISIYHTNFDTRFDKMGVLLNYGQIPLLKSRYLKYINNEENPYGINVIVAIACYGGYNVEDSILFNEASVARGLFHNTYYNTYETHEESSKVNNTTVDSRFTNIENENMVGLKPGYDYSNLEKSGLIKENTFLDDKSVLIGKVVNNVSNPDTSVDSSVFAKKGQEGYVDKTFITEGEEGYRIAKIRVRDNRFPVIGDKFCSRCGQKGTIGLIIPERDMPFTEEGIRPDIIINPHALPSRMTIGQLLETVMGKAGCGYGAFVDGTAFNNKGSKYQMFGKLLTNIGYNSTANEILYNGQTGEQMKMDIFIGPTYYMRLKQLVKDKINYRAKGPRTALTRQTVQGRANDGGLRIGEMEKDAVVAHGLTHFLQESLLIRGDEYFMAICNITGMISIYNENMNLFMSPLADGPIKFSGELVDDLKIDAITKYGRSFSIVRVPYAFKLLMQELNTMNICMRIITEDNIDQLSSMAFGGIIDDIEKPKVKNIKSFRPINLDKDDEMVKSLISEKDDEMVKSLISEKGDISSSKNEDDVKDDNEEPSFINKLQEYQSDLLDNLTSKSQDIFSQAKEAVLSIGTDTTFKPDSLTNTENTEPSTESNESNESNESEKIDTSEVTSEPIFNKPVIVAPSKKSETNVTSENKVIIVDDKTSPDTNELDKLPILATIEKDKNEEEEEEEKEGKEKKEIIIN